MTTTMAAEMKAWEEIVALMQRQRDLIIARNHAGLSELNEELEQKLAAVESGRENRPLRTDAALDQTSAADLDHLQRQVRTQACINRELLADAVAFAEFSLDLLYPQARGRVYDDSGQMKNRDTNTSVNRSA